MPLPRPRMRLCFTCIRPCNALALPSLLTRPSSIATPGKSLGVQHRVLATRSTESSPASIPLVDNEHTHQPQPSPLPPRQRSPHQWSHIVHRIRQSTAAGLVGSRTRAGTLDSSAGSKMGQIRSHMGHSHGHGGHSHDNTFLTSSNKSDPGVRITRIGLYVNLGMAIAKGAGGYVFNSQA